MKIRNGFVSNSSSSSFVIIGVKLTKAEKEKLWNDDDYEYDLIKGLDYIDDSEGDGTVIVGFKNSSYEDYGICGGSFHKEDFEKVENLLRKQLGPDRKLDVAVWYGMVAC